MPRNDGNVLIVQDERLERGHFILYDSDNDPLFVGHFEDWQQIDGSVYDATRMMAVNPLDHELVVEAMGAQPVEEVIH